MDRLRRDFRVCFVCFILFLFQFLRLAVHTGIHGTVADGCCGAVPGKYIYSETTTRRQRWVITLEEVDYKDNSLIHSSGLMEK